MKQQLLLFSCCPPWNLASPLSAAAPGTLKTPWRGCHIQARSGAEGGLFLSIIQAAEHVRALYCARGLCAPCWAWVGEEVTKPGERHSRHLVTLLICTCVLETVLKSSCKFVGGRVSLFLKKCLCSSEPCRTLLCVQEASF